MSLVTATQLASEFGVSKGAVSQWVSGGKLEGCFDGRGRNRRFDIQKCAKALGKNIDPGQRMGNAAKTGCAAKSLSKEPRQPKLNESAPLPKENMTRYEFARTLKAEEEGRTLRRRNAEAEGLYVLASEASRQVSKQIGQEIAEFETVLRDGARKVADIHGIDFKEVRQVLIDQWREHRAVRAKKIKASTEDMELAETERAENI